MNQLYDPATLLLSAVALLLLVRRQFGLYYVAFIPAVMNKETSLVLTGFLALFGTRRMRRPTLVGHVAAQILSWGIVR